MEYTKTFQRDNSNKALLSTDAKDLDRHNKQKAAMNEIKRLRAALDRINTLEDTVRKLQQDIEQFKTIGF